MTLIRKILGPKSKYNKSIPFTYLAKIYSIEDNEDVFDSHFADTICGLIGYLDKNNIDPEYVKLFGIYHKKEIPLDVDLCTSSSGRWLERPKICQSLEAHYKETFKECYKGHVAKEDCLYVDRDHDAN